MRSDQIFSPAPVETTGQLSCYDTSGLEVNCTGTGQDGDLQQGVIWPNPRFVIGTNMEQECITDELTGLMWVRTPDSTPRIWQDALTYANGLELCGHSDWRLPNIVELFSLYNAGEHNAVSWLNNQGFSNIQILNYWSSTTSAYEPANAWWVRISIGFLYKDPKTTSQYAWPVRNGN